MHPLRFLPFLLVGLLASCSDSTTEVKAKNEEPPPFEPLDVASLPEMTDPILARGRVVYLEACDRCHRIGKAGAPRTGERDAWSARIDPGLEVLVERAINGFESPKGNEMPARGGKDELSDDDVTAAVKFMVHLVPPTL